MFNVDTKSDIFSMGLALFEVVEGERVVRFTNDIYEALHKWNNAKKGERAHLFDDLRVKCHNWWWAPENRDRLAQIACGRNLQRRATMSIELASLLRDMMSFMPEDRPTAAQAATSMVISSHGRVPAHRLRSRRMQTDDSPTKLDAQAQVGNGEDLVDAGVQVRAPSNVDFGAQVCAKAVDAAAQACAPMVDAEAQDWPAEASLGAALDDIAVNASAFDFEDLLEPLPPIDTGNILEAAVQQAKLPSLGSAVVEEAAVAIATDAQRAPGLLHNHLKRRHPATTDDKIEAVRFIIKKARRIVEDEKVEVVATAVERLKEVVLGAPAVDALHQAAATLIVKAHAADTSKALTREHDLLFAAVIDDVPRPPNGSADVRRVVFEVATRRGKCWWAKQRESRIKWLKGEVEAKKPGRRPGEGKNKPKPAVDSDEDL